MHNYLEDEISVDNIVSYAEACITVEETIQNLSKDGFKYLIVPSRGASPIVETASAYHHVKRRKQTSTSGLEGITKIVGSPFSRQIYLPFTADIPSSITGIESNQIRDYWSRVLACIVNGTTNDPHYQLYDYIRTEICPIGFTSPLETRLAKEKFIFIDTVVSGRAIFEIISSFEKLELFQCHFILVIDENGKKLEGKYKPTLFKLVAEGRVTLIYMNRLFTEDRGPAVSGVWSVNFPDLMQQALNDIPGFSSSGAIGAGMYYLESRLRDDKSNQHITFANGVLHTLLFSAILETRYKSTMQGFIDEFLDHIGKNRLFREEATVDVARPLIISNVRNFTSIESSSSHALRVAFSKDEAAKIILGFRQRYEATWR